MTVFKSVRILILLLFLAIVAFYSKSQRLQSRSWTEPLEVTIYPINGDGIPEIDQYIENLEDQDFASIDRFFQEESEAYSVITSQPTITRLGSVLKKYPPPSPSPNSNVTTRLWWGLKFRWWSFRNTPDSESNLRRIRVFVHYHEAIEGRKLQHSLGLDKGLLAIVHAFASTEQIEQNNIII